MVAVVVADRPLRPLLQSPKPCHRNSKLVLLAPRRTLLREPNKPQASKDNDQGCLARWPQLQRKVSPTLPIPRWQCRVPDVDKVNELTLIQWRGRRFLDRSCHRWHVWRRIDPGGGAATSRQLALIAGSGNELPEQQLGRSQLR